MSHAQSDGDALDRSILPIPDRPFKGVANRTLAGSVADFPTRFTLPREHPMFFSCSLTMLGSETRRRSAARARARRSNGWHSEGLRYNRFHVTALCSPSRAALLSGRNHHAVGFGSVAEFCGGWPGYNCDVAQERRVGRGDPAQ